MKKIYALFAITLMLASCDTNTGNEAIVYNTDELQETEMESLKIEKVPLNFITGNPAAIEFALDSLLVIFDWNSGDKVCHIVNRKGELKASFGMKGKKETELIAPDKVFISAGGDSAFIYDFTGTKMVGFDLRKVLDGDEENAATSVNVRKFIEDSRCNFFYTVRRGKDGDMFGFGFDDTRITWIKDGDIVCRYREYPHVDPDKECNWSIWRDMANYALSPDTRHIVITTANGALFEILNVNGNGIESKTVKAFYKPEYTLFKGMNPKSINSTEETIYGFHAVYAGEKYFYANMGGEKEKDLDKNNHLNELLVFDYDGRLARKFNAGVIFNCLAVDKNGELFMFGHRSDYETELYKCKLDVH